MIINKLHKYFYGSSNLTLIIVSVRVLSLNQSSIVNLLTNLVSQFWDGNQVKCISNKIASLKFHGQLELIALFGPHHVI